MHNFNLLYSVLTIAVVLNVILGTCAMLIYLERKISAWVQDRRGPNRVGPWGLFQSIADGLKFLFKEDIIPGHVDKLLYLAAPALAVSTALLAFAVVPFGATTPPPRPPVPIAANATAKDKADYQERHAAFKKEMEEYENSYQFVIAPGLSIGILFLLAISSLNVYGVILGGWSANNKYSLLGALRSSAQIISYEIPMAMSVVGLFILTGSLNLEWLIAYQTDSARGPGVWYIFLQPLGFLLFLVSAFAETNRLPFDLPEAEQELVGGYHTEYSALKFALFFLGEYAHMITTSFLLVILFFGGWNLFLISGPDSHWLIKLIVMGVKMSFFIVFFMLIRWTIPRFRFDQLMAMAWKVMIPLALVNLLFVMFVKEFDLPLWILPIASVALFIGAGAVATLRGPGPPKKTPIEMRGRQPSEPVTL